MLKELQTKHAIKCEQFCQTLRPMNFVLGYSSPIRKATTDITRKNALNACKTGRSGAIQWMVSRFDEYKNLYFAEKDSHL
mmetsp:Transcript_2373/g.3057  ORF Transcript_2373/g.3057 Transcript_2373/m.3057 type:complete len:80 (+) Transcript_2373:208-447(+)